VPCVLVAFPSTMLFPLESRTEVAPALRRPMLLSVTVELETLAMATLAEPLCTAMPLCI
jgi:hypothetical protein